MQSRDAFLISWFKKSKELPEYMDVEPNRQKKIVNSRSVKRLVPKGEERAEPPPHILTL